MNNKILRKIIVSKSRNRRISQILEHLESTSEWRYEKENSRFNHYNKFALIDEMRKNSERILYLRERMKEVKCGS